MKNWTIGKRVTVGFGTLLVLVIGLAVTNIVMLTGIKGHLAEIVDDGMVGMGLSAKVSFNTSESERLQLEYLRAKTDLERSDAEAKINALIAENNKLLKDYEQTIVREEDRKSFDRLMATRVAFGAQRSKMFELARAGKIAEAEAQNLASGPAFNAFQTACNAMFDANSDFGTTTGRTAQADLAKMQWITIGVTLFCVLVGGGFAVLIVVGLKKVLRNVSAALQDGSEQMVSASSQVSAASQSLAEGASEQAASLEETSSSLEEMSSMTRRNADNAENAKKLADQTRAAADMGATDMKEMSQAMAEIKNASDNIAKIIKTIDEIAFQTNILALNAAVEAARAGEAGMGFAVVADEVRRLAQRSANAAKETADKIQDAITKSEHGVRISSKVAQSLGDIVTKACQVDQLIGDIAAASKEQSQGITQVNMAVTQMDKVTQSSAASAEETASAAEELNAQAESLKDAVVELARLVEQRGLVEKPRLVHKKTSPADDALSAAMGDFAKAGGSRNGKSEKHQPSQTLTTPANANLQMIPSRKEPAAATDADFRDF